MALIAQVVFLLKCGHAQPHKVTDATDYSTMHRLQGTGQRDVVRSPHDAQSHAGGECPWA